MSRLWILLVLGVSSAHFNSSPAVSVLKGTATLSWQIPQIELRSGLYFHVLSPAGFTAFIVLPQGSLVRLGNYSSRVQLMPSNFTEGYSGRDTTFTLRNISSTDAGTYSCGAGGRTSEQSISDCGQMLVVLGKPTKPSLTSPNTTTIYNNQVTLTCTSTSTSIPQGHGLSLTYTWARDGTITAFNTGTTFTFTVTSRDPQKYRCRADESRGLESDWSDVYTIEPEYGANISEFSLSSATGHVTVNEGETVSLKCQVNSNLSATIRFLNGSQELKRGDNSLTVTNTWQTTCRQRGNYSCITNDSIGPVNVRSLTLAVKCSPRPDETSPVQHQFVSMTGSNVTLWMSVLSYPAPTYTWSRSNSSSRDLSGSLSVVSDISVNISLTLTSLRREGFGLYNLNISNGVGEDHVTTFEVVPQETSTSRTDIHAIGVGIGFGICGLVVLVLLFVVAWMYGRKKRSDNPELSAPAEDTNPYSDMDHVNSDRQTYTALEFKAIPGKDNCTLTSINVDIV